MRVRPIGSTMKVKRLSGGLRWLSLFAAVCVLALGARLGEQKTLAQDSPLSSTSTGQLGISPEEPVAPPKPIIVRTPAPSADRSTQRNQSSPASEAAKVATPAPVIPDPDPNNPVAVQSTNLLKLAYSLKSEVDKTTKDTLSVTVVRQAAEIEQLARKMRSK